MSRRNPKGWLGMIKIKEILRLSELGLSQSEIARSVKVHRTTARDYVSKARARGLTYESIRDVGESELRELFDKKLRGRSIKDDELDFVYLKRELTRPGVTRRLLWEEYLKDHPDGYGYSQFCIRYRQWLKSSKLSMRKDYRAGESTLVDYCGQTVEIVDKETGEISQAQIFVATLGASNLIFAEATPSQKLVCWLGSHVRAFEFFGGVTEKIIPDNLKSGVKSPCFYEPELNPSYRDLAEHYNVAVIPARVRKPQDKAKVETAVQIVERRILAKLRNYTFYSVAELNAAIKPLLAEINSSEMKGYGASRDELFAQIEKGTLSALPQTAYRFASWKKAKVNIDYHIEIKRHYYSVPYKLVHKYVMVKISEKTIEIFNDNIRIALHTRNDTPGRHSTEKEHMPVSHRYMKDWSPTRLLDWASKIGPQTKIQVNTILLSRTHPEQGYRSALGLLSLSKKYGSDRLESACNKANCLGITSMRSIKNMLQTGNDKISTNAKNDIPPVQHANIRGDAEFH